MKKGILDIVRHRASMLCEDLKVFFKKQFTWRTFGRVVICVSYVFLLKFGAGCTYKPADPASASDGAAVLEAAETQVPPTPTTEPNLSPEEIREQKLNEIAEVVSENDNRFTIEELEAYLREYGTGWEGGVEGWIAYYQRTLATFQYYFVKDNKNGSGVLPCVAPYLHTEERTMSDKNNFSTPDVINNETFEKIVESLYYDLYLDTTDDKLGWDKEPGKYSVVFYMTQEVDKDGEQFDVMFPNIGGYFFENAEGDIVHVPIEDAINKDLSDEEIALFTDEVLTSLKTNEGWIMFRTDKYGRLSKRWNFKDFYNLLHSPAYQEQ